MLRSINISEANTVCAYREPIKEPGSKVTASNSYALNKTPVNKKKKTTQNTKTPTPNDAIFSNDKENPYVSPMKNHPLFP